MEVDYSLLEDGPGNEGIDAAIESTPEAEIQAEPEVAPQQPTGDVGHRLEPTNEPESETAENFDPETLTPREKILLERLEAATRANLDQAKETARESDQPPVLNVEERNFLEGLDLDEVLGNAENLNRVLMAVHRHAMEVASKIAAENIMRSLPETISNYVTRHVSMSEMVRDFYSSNPDIAQVKGTMAQVANEVANQSPELTPPQVFAEAAKRVRVMLKLNPNGGQKPQPKRPALVTQRGGRRSVPELTGMAKDIEDLIS